jgi:iron-sulfur cluster assembly accessory protein
MINLSKAAIGEIRRLQLSRKKQDARLRLAVQTGGCQSLYYIIDFDETMNSSDRLYDCNGVSLIVDEASFPYISELTLDYSEDLMGGGFRFHNPQAISSCGCGNSFSIQT